MRFANDFHSWLRHSRKSLANRLTPDPKMVIHGNSCIILYISSDLALGYHSFAPNLQYVSPWNWLRIFPVFQFWASRSWVVKSSWTTRRSTVSSSCPSLPPSRLIWSPIPWPTRHAHACRVTCIVTSTAARFSTPTTRPHSTAARAAVSASSVLWWTWPAAAIMPSAGHCGTTATSSDIWWTLVMTSDGGCWQLWWWHLWANITLLC